jgi:hypothetical protein
MDVSKETLSTYTLAGLVEQYNEIVPADKKVKKFRDKETGFRRLMWAKNTYGQGHKSIPAAPESPEYPVRTALVLLNECREMEGVTRKQYIALCMAKGIKKTTAARQWLTPQEELKRRIEKWKK